MIQKFTLLAILALSLVGCASVQMGDPQKDVELKAFTAKSDVAGIYVYRNESLGGAVRMDIDIDGKPLGQTMARNYLYKEVTPGWHMLTSKSENTDNIELNVVAGKLYYVWQEVKMGLMYARIKLHPVSDEEGKKGVLESQLVLSK